MAALNELYPGLLTKAHTVIHVKIYLNFEQTQIHIFQFAICFDAMKLYLTVVTLSLTEVKDRLSQQEACCLLC